MTDIQKSFFVSGYDTEIDKLEEELDCNINFFTNLNATLSELIDEKINGVNFYDNTTESKGMSTSLYSLGKCEFIISSPIPIDPNNTTGKKQSSVVINE